jgi:hypothetical protein
VLQQLAQGDEEGALRELKTAHEQLMAQAQAAEPAPEQEIGVPGGKAGPGRGNKTVANGHGFKPASQLSSNSWDRILPRLARDAPEVLERVKAGEFRSARAAAIEAGIIKPEGGVAVRHSRPASQFSSESWGVRFRSPGWSSSPSVHPGP